MGSVKNGLKLKIKFDGQYVNRSPAPDPQAAVPAAALPLAASARVHDGITIKDALRAIGKMGIGGLPPGQGLMPAAPLHFRNLAQALRDKPSKAGRAPTPETSENAEEELRKALAGYRTAKGSSSTAGKPAWGSAKPNIQQASHPSTSKAVKPVLASGKPQSSAPSRLRETSPSEQPMGGVQAVAHGRKGSASLDTAQPMVGMPSSAAAPRAPGKPPKQPMPAGVKAAAVKPSKQVQRDRDVSPVADTGSHRPSNTSAVQTTAAKPVPADLRTAKPAKNASLPAPGKRSREASPPFQADPTLAPTAIQQRASQQITTAAPALKRIRKGSPSVEATGLISAATAGPKSAVTAPAAPQSCLETKSRQPLVTADGLQQPSVAAATPAAATETKVQHAAAVASATESTQRKASVPASAELVTDSEGASKQVEAKGTAAPATVSSLKPTATPSNESAQRSAQTLLNAAVTPAEPDLHSRDQPGSVTAAPAAAAEAAAGNAAPPIMLKKRRGSAAVPAPAPAVPATAEADKSAKEHIQPAGQEANMTGRPSDSGTAQHTKMAPLTKALPPEEHERSRKPQPVQADGLAVLTKQPKQNAPTTDPGGMGPSVMGPSREPMLTGVAPSRGADPRASATPAAALPSAAARAGAVLPAGAQISTKQTTPLTRAKPQTAQDQDSKPATSKPASAPKPPAPAVGRLYQPATAADAEVKDAGLPAPASEAPAAPGTHAAAPGAVIAGHSGKGAVTRTSASTSEPKAVPLSQSAAPDAKADLAKTNEAAQIAKVASGSGGRQREAGAVAKAQLSKASETAAVADDKQRAGIAPGTSKAAFKVDAVNSAGAVEAAPRRKPEADAAAVPADSKQETAKQAPKFAAVRLAGPMPQKGLLWQKGLKPKAPGLATKPKGSPAPLNVLQQAAEAELAKVAQDHAPAPALAPAPAQLPLSPASEQAARPASCTADAAESEGGRRFEERAYPNNRPPAPHPRGRSRDTPAGSDRQSYSRSRSRSYTTSRSRSPSQSSARPAQRQPQSHRHRSGSRDGPKQDRHNDHAGRDYRYERHESRHDRQTHRSRDTRDSHRAGNKAERDPHDRPRDRHRDRDQDRGRNRVGSGSRHDERDRDRRRNDGGHRRDGDRDRDRDKKQHKSSKRNAPEPHGLPVVDGVLLSPDNVSRAKQGRAVKDLTGQWVESAGLLDKAYPSQAHPTSTRPPSEAPSASLGQSDRQTTASPDLPGPPAPVSGLARQASSGLQNAPSGKGPPSVDAVRAFSVPHTQASHTVAGTSTDLPTARKAAAVQESAVDSAATSRQVADAAAITGSAKAECQAAVPLAELPAKAAEVVASAAVVAPSSNADAQPAQQLATATNALQQPAAVPTAAPTSTAAAVASQAVPAKPPAVSARTPSPGSLQHASFAMPSVTGPPVLAPLPQLGPSPPQLAALPPYAQQWQHMYGMDPQQQQMYAMQYGGYPYTEQQYLAAQGYGGMAQAGIGIGSPPLIPGSGLPVPGPMPPAGVPPPRPPPLGPNSPPPKRPLAQAQPSSHQNPLYSPILIPTASPKPDQAAALAAPASSASPEPPTQQARRVVRLPEAGHAAAADTALQTTGSGRLHRQDSRGDGRADRKGRRAELQGRGTDREVASNSGQPGHTSSGDSARGGQNGAVPQGRAGATRPTADQRRAQGKLGQVNKMGVTHARTGGKAQAQTQDEGEEPIKGRMQKIAERQARERLERAASATSSELARAAEPSLGQLAPEPGAVGKGPSRLGPGRTVSGELAQAASGVGPLAPVPGVTAGKGPSRLGPAGKDAAKLSRKRPLPVEAGASASASQASWNDPGQEMVSPLKRSRTSQPAHAPSEAAELPADLPAKMAQILDHFSNPDKARLMAEPPERLASKAARQLQRALDSERDSEGIVGPEAIQRALQASVWYLHQAAVLDRPNALGVNTRVFAALDSAISALELTLRLHRRVTYIHVLQKDGITLLTQKLLAAALQRRAEAERLAVASASSHVKLARQDGIYFPSGLGGCQGTNSLQRLAAGRPVPQDYVQQDWLLLQASMKGSQRLLELLASNRRLTASLTTSPDSKELAAIAQTRREVHIDLAALSMDLSGSIIDVVHLSHRALACLFRLR